MLIGGSPCQGFSFAGKQLAFDDPRSALFFVYVDILNHIRSLNPGVKFLLENVKMKKEHLAVITEQLGVDPVFINSALVSAQNRQRYYWANWEFGQPEDKGIVLADVLEGDGFGIIKSHGEIKERNEKSQCIDANYHKGVDNHGQRTMIRPGAIVGRKIDENGKRNDTLDQKPVQCLEVQAHGKSRCLSTVAKDTVVSPMEPGRYPLQGKAYNRKDGLGKDLDKAYSLNASDWRGLNRNQTQTAVSDGISYRKLTPVECERLQTLPDNYSAAIETLSYSMYNYKEINNKESLYLCDVKLIDAKENREQKSMATFALCTTSDLLGMEIMSCQRLKAIKSQSVNIAIERLEKKAAGYRDWETNQIGRAHV